MNILVTGGAGFIGSALCNALASAGHVVRVLDRKPPDGMHGRAAGEYVQDDLSDVARAAEALRDIEAVYHLAWAFYPEDPRREIEENLLGTLNLLEACQTSQVRRFIFGSSATVYGPTGAEPARETDLCRPHMTTIGGPVYANTKLACEQYCLGAQLEAMAVTVMRIHGVFSRDRLAQFSKMIEQAKKCQDVIAIAHAGGQYAHLDDVIWALCEILARGDAGGEIFNLAGHRNYRDRDMAEYIASKACTSSNVMLIDDPGEEMISVSVEKLSQTMGYAPRRTDFLREFIDAQFP
jgi:nucleoside-diphosphate-sugar epimerase